LQSFLTAAVGVAIFTYMTSADVGYLDLSQPSYDEALCVTSWPLRHQHESWFVQDVWVDFWNYRNDMLAYINDKSCTPSTFVPEKTTCSVLDVPLHDMQRKLGIPLGRNEEYGPYNDLLEVYAFVFLYLTICMWVAVIIHDFTLLSARNQHLCLDLRGVDRAFPCFRKLLCLTGWSAWRGKLVGSKGAVRVLLLCAAPFVVIWALTVFLGIICPCVSLLFMRYPIRLGRLQIFVLCIMITALCVSLAGRSFVSLGGRGYRPRYAITWEAGAIGGGDCICGCVFSFSAGGVWQVLVMAITIAYKSVMLGLRCLKGLRRANWGNLMTVMFAVPLTVYPVEWTQPDGKPIMFRKEGDPVQAEPAFDPFAMMDEQLNSARTTCDLRPSSITANPVKNVGKEKSRRDRMSAPRLETTAIRSPQMFKEEIGCCGFPYFSKASVGEAYSEEEDVEEQEASGTATTRSEEPGAAGEARPASDDENRANRSV